MRVLIIGANGQIGRRLVKLLQHGNGFEPVAMVRVAEQMEQFRNEGVEAVLGDLEQGVSDLAGVLGEARVRAVVFTAGSGGGTGAEKTLLVDLDGAVKMMEACTKAGVSRFVMVSAIGVHTRQNWIAALAPYQAAKHYADRMLMDSGLDWTIVRPGKLENGDGSGRVEIAETLPRATIPRADVARLLKSVLATPATVGKAFDVVSGEVEIDEAVERYANSSRVDTRSG